jgi:hypothetical protein
MPADFIDQLRSLNITGEVLLTQVDEQYLVEYLNIKSIGLKKNFIK